MKASLTVDTMGRRLYVEWDPLAPVTPLGQLVFFSQFLASSGLYSKWVAGGPLHHTSPQAPSVGDVLGTAVLAILSEYPGSFVRIFRNQCPNSPEYALKKDGHFLRKL